MSDGYDEDGDELSPPDWSRIDVRSRAVQGGVSKSPVGDPTRWGGSVTQIITSPPPISDYASQQLVRAQADDAYGRLWAMTGTVNATPALWALPNGPGGRVAVLRVSQGSGQAVVNQLFDLRTLTDIGLAGGYRALAPLGSGREERSFAIIGGIIGQQWAAFVELSLFPLTGIVDAPVTTTVIACALAAGTNL